MGLNQIETIENQIMKAHFALTALFAIVLTTSSSTLVHAQIQDITINNGQGTSPSDYSAITGQNTNPDPRVVNGTPVDALGYVNEGDIATKEWDLEAFGYNPTSNALTYVGGFDPASTNYDPVDGISNWHLGDIFLSAGSVTQPTGLTANSTYTNPGYTYAIHFILPTNGSLNLTYQIYKLTVGESELETVFFNQNLDSDPYALDLNNLKGDTLVSINGQTTFSATVTKDTNAQVNTLLDETLFDTTADKASTTADNYVLSLNLPSSLDLTSFEASLTEQCGNDDLKGAYSVPTHLVPLPEPRSISFALVAGVLFFVLSGCRVVTYKLGVTFE
jgi:hypothetical protein